MDSTRRNEIRVTVSGLIAVALLAAVMAVVMATTVGSNFRTLLPGAGEKQTPTSSLGLVERP